MSFSGWAVSMRATERVPSAKETVIVPPTRDDVVRREDRAFLADDDAGPQPLGLRVATGPGRLDDHEARTIIRGPELRRMRLSTGSRRAHVLNVGITRVV
jgi:hypothetical protein